MTRTLEDANQTVNDATRILRDERDRIDEAISAIGRCADALEALAGIDISIPVGQGRSAEAIEEMAATIYYGIRAQRLPTIEKLEREARVGVAKETPEDGPWVGQVER